MSGTASEPHHTTATTVWYSFQLLRPTTAIPLRYGWGMGGPGTRRFKTSYMGIAASIALFCCLPSVRMGLRGERVALDLDDYDLEGIIQGLQRGEFKSLDLVLAYKERISWINDQLRAIGSINPDAEAIATERDEQREAGHLQGPLHGVPFLVKDTFATLDQMDTTGGSYALVGAKYKNESYVVARLRAAGAVLLAKTNLSQWGMSRSSKCPNGWSALYGQALGGFHDDQDPQGSSSGSAIAACYNLASFTIGAETGGSILYPAQRNAVVGVKPTVGLTSRSGTIPINPEQDSVGPLTRWVKDSAIVLEAIAGKDAMDPATSEIPFNVPPNYRISCQENAMKNLRVAIPGVVYDVIASDTELNTAFREAVELIHSLGATVVDNADFETWKPSAGLREDLFPDIVLRESYKHFFDDLEFNPHGISNISDLIEFTKKVPEEQYDRFGAEWFENARDAPGDSTTKDFLDSKARMENFGQDIPRLLDRYSCDVLLATTSTDLPIDLGRLPGISVPLGYYSKDRKPIRGSDKLFTKGPHIPFSVTFVGRRFSETTLFAAAYAFEQATLIGAKRKRQFVVHLSPKNVQVELQRSHLA